MDVNVVEAQDPQPHSICDDTEWDCIPGGAIIRTERDDGTDITRCSLTCEIQYQSIDHLMTSAHCFNACDEDPIGYHLKHGGEVIGEVVEYDVNLDFAIIEPVDGLKMDDSIIDESQSIFGHVTRDGVEDLRDSGETVYHYGSTTCKTSGVVDGITSNLSGSCDFDIEAPRMTTNADPGDSGGPHYHHEQSLLIDALGIIGPHWGGDTYEWAPPGYTITDQYDITFGGSTCDGL